MLIDMNQIVQLTTSGRRPLRLSDNALKALDRAIFHCMEVEAYNDCFEEIEPVYKVLSSIAEAATNGTQYADGEYYYHPTDGYFDIYPGWFDVYLKWTKLLKVTYDYYMRRPLEEVVKWISIEDLIDVMDAYERCHSVLAWYISTRPEDEKWKLINSFSPIKESKEEEKHEDQ